MKLERESTILFQGDSITDAGRDRSNPDSLGNGYAYLIAARLLADFPELALRFVNRGISGNRSADLVKRWHEDCLAVRPSVLSIMIGINDTWRRYDSASPTSADEYRTNLETLLTKSRAVGITQVVLLEPFVLATPPDRKAWREDLDPKIAAARDLAAEFRTEYVPLDGLLNAAAIATEPADWAPDGVHPSLAGHQFIADRWLELVEVE